MNSTDNNKSNSNDLSSPSSDAQPNYEHDDIQDFSLTKSKGEVSPLERSSTAADVKLDSESTDSVNGQTDAKKSDDASQSASDREHRSHSGSSSSSHRSSSGSSSSHRSSSGSSSSHRSSSGSSSSHRSSSGSSSSHRSSSGSSSSHRSSSDSSSSHRSSSGSSSSHRSSSGSSLSASAPSQVDILAKKYQVITDPDSGSEQSSYGSKRRSKHHHHRKRVSKPIVRVLRVIALFVLVLVVGAAGALIVLNEIGKKSVAPEAVGIEENEYAAVYDEGKTVVYNGMKYALNENLVTIAFMGVDKSELGTEDNAIGTAGQADVIMIAAFDVKNGSAQVLSVPRDSMVDVNLYTVSGQYVGVEQMQICLAYAYGNGTDSSCKNVISSLERLLYGIPINLYASMDLAGISAMNDAIGGVTLTASETIYDVVTAGETVTLSGNNAISYVRYRDTSLLNSDSLRRDRQIQYIKAFASQTMRKVVGDFSLVRNLYNTALAYSHTNITLSMVTYLATTAVSRSINFDNFYSLAGEMTEGDPYAQYIVDEQAAFETVLKVFYTPLGEAESVTAEATTN